MQSDNSENIAALQVKIVKLNQKVDRILEALKIEDPSQRDKKDD